MISPATVSWTIDTTLNIMKYHLYMMYYMPLLNMICVTAVERFVLRHNQTHVQQHSNG